MIKQEGKYYLYRHIRLDKNEPFYIGIGTKKDKIFKTTTSEYERAYTKYKRSDYWKKIVNKANYEVEILLESDNYDFIKQKEIEFIALHGRRDLEKGTLVNLTDGGDGSIGRLYTEEQKEAKRASRIGVKRPPDTLKKMKEYNESVIKNNAQIKENEKYYTKYGTLTILKYYSGRNCTVQFEDGTILENIMYTSIKKGSVENRNHPSVHNVGYIGYGKYKVSDYRDEYSCWNTLIKSTITNNSEWSIVQEWLNFQNFAEWYIKNKIQNFPLNREILQESNKIYSPETCCFVPHEIHAITAKLNTVSKKDKSLPVGVSTVGKKYRAVCAKGEKCVFETIEEAQEVYKAYKRERLITLANKYKHLINKKVYNKIINYGM